MDNKEKLTDLELNDSELESVAGGAPDIFVTLMRCDVCGYETVWAGNYLDGSMHWCPKHTQRVPICLADYPSFHGVCEAP